MYGTHFRFNYGIEHSATKRYITNSLHLFSKKTGKMDPAKLRNFRVGRAFRAMGIATIVSTAVTGVVVYMYNKKEIATARKFYHWNGMFY
ncbi:unnamed protein product [Schistosoma intercalatum]|nr:unnamed protein product [Schistosoma intercalatum]